MKSRSFVLMFALAWLVATLVGCTPMLQPQPFNRAANPGIKKIALLRVPEPVELTVKNIGGIGNAFGAIGAIAEAAAESGRNDEFTERMRKQQLRLGEPMAQAIEAALRKHGYDVTFLDQRPGAKEDDEADYSRIRTDADAILDVRFPAAGYMSTAGSTDYLPWIRADARLVSAKGNVRLYQQPFSYGANMKIGEHFPSSARYAYGDFDTLMGKSQEAAEGLKTGIGMIAARIAEQLR